MLKARPLPASPKERRKAKEFKREMATFPSFNFI
jgi:hypothetical protein